METEEIQIIRRPAARKPREFIVEQYDPIMPEVTEIPAYEIEDEIIATPTESRPVIKGKKIVGAKVDSWNRGYRPGGGDVKIYNKGLQFEYQEEPSIETYDRSFTKYQGVVRIDTEIDAPEETTVEVITRPFEVERVSRSVTVKREMKKPPTPPPEPVRAILFIYIIFLY
jgi:hypothetical protein